MKNLFKNLMLVAVAAMAFTACQNDNDFAGNAAGEGTTTISVVANLDDTRSAFTGEKGDIGYQSVWNGGEAVKAYVVSDGGYANYYNVVASNEAVVEAENGATQAHFNLSFNSSLSDGTLYIVTAADGSVVDCEGTGYNYDGGQKPKITLPTKQTPLENSVDPKAHILIYENNDFRASQSTDIEATFKHYAAYGKLSLKNFTVEGVTSYVLNINDKVYTINSSKTENVWFACEPATVEDMTITVNTADGAYKKKIVEDSNRSLEFVKGQVSTFTVNMEGATTGEAVDTFTAQYMATDLYYDSTNDCFVFTVAEYETFWVKLNSADCPDHTTIKEGNYTGIASKTVPQGSFSVTQKIQYLEGWTSTSPDSTMNVSYVDGKYQILINYVGKWGGDGQVGYKDVPEGWIVPVEGGDDSGDEPETPGEGGGDEPETPGEGFIQMTKLYYDASAANLHNFILTDSGNNKITISMNKQDVLTTWIPKYEYPSQSLNIANANPGYFSLQYENAKINGTSYQLNSTGNTLKVVSSANGGNHEIELYVVTSGGDEYKFKFSGNLGL